MAFNPHLLNTAAPPVMEARRWIEGQVFPKDRPLINVSQAAPVDPPPDGLRHAMAETVLREDAAHLYGPVLGLPELREELAQQWSTAYNGSIGPSQVAITSGCNQAFAASIATLASQGDEIILPTPWYFNHKMWIDMQGIRAVPLAIQQNLLPDPDQAKALITDRTRAIALVTPNNPGGVEYPSDLVQAFFDLARDHGIALILDETYRDFDSRTGPPHPLFQDPKWDDTLIHLYSFSKAYRLTGHRVGAMVTSVQRLAEAEKFLDSVSICPNQIGQRGALWGMQNLSQWLAGERAEILDRRAAITAGFPDLEGWSLLGCGAYFAYASYPHAVKSDAFAQKLVTEASVLLLPGTMFTPAGDPAGERQLRIAFANVDRDGIKNLFDRLKNISD
ncbi:MAG: aminotransferase [Pseudoruegeria sp.]